MGQPIQTNTLFLDRDGVINRRTPGEYVARWEEFTFLPGALEAMPKLALLFDRIVIVTNQQGVAKGLMTAADLDDMHEKMMNAINQAGGRIDRIYACTQLATSQLNGRKPAPDMALQAKADFPEIAFDRSVMVGDSLSDLQFGHGLGMKNVWITTKTDELTRIQTWVDEDPTGCWQSHASLLDFALIF